MDNRLLHTPEGVRDIYGDELQKKLKLERILHKKVASFGYHDIETPSFEYFDIFSREIGTTPSREIYKFFDSENNTLALRPDFTPGVARATNKYFMEDIHPIRLCYMGNTFSNRSDLQGKLKEVTELGVEYMREPSVDADAEMIDMTVELLKTAGLDEFQICIGTVEYFRGLCEAAGLDRETEEALSDHIRNKNYFGIQDVLNDVKMPADIKKTLTSFSDYFGNVDVLDEAAERVKKVPRSLAAINRLKALYEKLKIYGVQNYLTFDLGMISQHDYYTGILFQAYTFGTGEPIVRGGRYDNLLGRFGKPGAAVGFTVVVDQLLNTLNQQHIVIDRDCNNALVVYDSDSFEAAVRESGSLRLDGVHAEMILYSPDMTQESINAYAQEIHAAKIYRIRGGKTEVQKI